MYCSLAFPRRAAVLLVAAVVTLLAPALGRASAEDIAVTAGSLDARGSFGNGDLVLQGTHGFTFTGVTHSGNFIAGECNGGPCNAGARLGLFASWSGMDLPPLATRSTSGCTHRHRPVTSSSTTRR